MTRLLAASFAPLLLCLGSAAWGAPASAGHAAACVAALKGREATLTETLKAGGAGVEPELLRVVQSGYAFVGRQYLAGLGEAEARQLLASAEQAFKALSPDSRKLRQAQCLQEGDRLYAQASGLERSLITTAAQRRIKRMKSR